MRSPFSNFWNSPLAAGIRPMYSGYLAVPELFSPRPYRRSRRIWRRPRICLQISCPEKQLPSCVSTRFFGETDAHAFRLIRQFICKRVSVPHHHRQCLSAWRSETGCRAVSAILGSIPRESSVGSEQLQQKRSQTSSRDGRGLPERAPNHRRTERLLPGFLIQPASFL